MKQIAMLLAILLALSASSCGGDTPAADATASPGADTTTAANDQTYQLPKADFGGREVQFYLSTNRTIMGITEENGDTINDAVYRRNRKVEELYNVSFKYTMGSDTTSDFPAWYASAEASIMAGDDSIDIMGGYFYRLASTALTNGLFQDLSSMPEIDFSQPWWIGNLQQAASIGNKLYIATGNIDPGFYNRIYALVFNKELAAGVGAGNLYESVNSGTWTFDKLKSVAKLGTRDLNGDSQMDDKVQYGYATGWNMSVDAYNNAFDVSFVDIDKNGFPSLVKFNEKIADTTNSLKEFMLDSGHVFYVADANIPAPQFSMFEEGRALLLVTPMMDLQKMRSFDVDFGILPYPKWNEEQEDYVSFCATDPVAGYVVPITTDPKLAGCLIEALAYYGWKDVYPEYYERALKGKNTRDDESSAMLDIIFNNIKYNFVQIYGYAFQVTPFLLLRNALRNDLEIASTFEANRQGYEETIASLIDALK